MGINEFHTKLKKGPLNLITDVEGVQIGHVTIEDEDIHTGVTAIRLHDDIFHEKLLSASYVINGFGKTTGLVQINELGTLESHIVLTNTLNVGIAQQSLVKYMLKHNPDIGNTTGTVNVVVGECNDGYLNDIRGLHVKEEHVFEALDNASKEFTEGNVGAGTGMMCFSMKGGIGSASRIVHLDKNYTIGVLVLTNFGSFKDFRFQDMDTSHLSIKDYLRKDQGSCIIIIATDAPLSSRQLQRMTRHVPVSLARTGSYIGNGSGDIAIAFSTANKIPHYPMEKAMAFTFIHENYIDLFNRAMVDACEEAILSSLMHSSTTTSKGRTVPSLKDLLKQ